MTVLAAALVAAACSSAREASQVDALKASDIRALRWLAPGADKVEFLTVLPVSCEKPAASAEAEERRHLGRLAFESPALLGGAAARMELSCSSCHLNGRDNPNFFIAGISNNPGSADVTSSIFSKTRGDGNLNPVPIPDIAAKDGKQIRDRKSEEFRAKVRGLVVEEFDGQTPPAQVFDNLIEYLDGIELCIEPDLLRTGPSVDRDLSDARYLAEAGSRTRQEAPEASRFYFRASRYKLARIYERFAEPDMALIRARLVELSRKLSDLAEGKQPEAILTPGDWTGVKFMLDQRSLQSLYVPDVLRAALAGP